MVVQFFFKKDSISTELPYKMYGNRHFLQQSYMECYSRYKKDQEAKGERVLGCSTFIKLKPENIKKRSKTPYKEYLCDTCLNYGLLNDGVYYAKVEGIVHGFTSFVIQSVCPLSTTTV